MSDSANPALSPAPPPVAPVPPRAVPAWGIWCRFLEGFRKSPAGLEAESARLAIVARLRRFSTTHVADQPVIEKILSALYRGVPLLQAALGWEEPSVGGKASKRTNTDRRRGEQWRLVLAFSGFETLTKALLSQKGRGGLGADHFRSILTGCELPEYVPLDVPELRESLREDWFTAETQNDLLDFLGLDYGDAKITATWLVERRAMANWIEGLCLAKALRNATVHGALSASKVEEWKLAHAIRRLIDDLAVVAGAILQRLTAEEV